MENRLAERITGYRPRHDIFDSGRGSAATPACGCFQRFGDNTRSGALASALWALPQAEVHVWLASLADYSATQLETAACQLLSRQELSRCESLRQLSQRQSSILGRVLLRKVLSNYADIAPQDWQIDVAEGGRPVSKSAPVSFNVSRSEQWVVVATATQSALLGVDIECIRARDVVRLAQRFFTARELDDLLARGKDSQRQRFYQYWSLREAYLKACGIGLRVSLDSFSFTIGDEGDIFLHDKRNTHNWQFRSASLGDGTSLSLALGSAAPISCVRAFTVHNGGIRQQSLDDLAVKTPSS